MATPRRSLCDWRPWESPPNEELVRRPLSSCKRLCFTNKVLDGGLETLDRSCDDTLNDPMEGLNDSLDDTMPLCCKDSPGMLVSVSNNPMIHVGESKHGVLEMIQAKLECFEEYSSTLTCRMIHGDYAASGGIGLTWLEVCQRQAKVLPEVGPVHAVRVVIDMSLVCKLQIVWPVVHTVHQIALRCHDDEGLFKLLQQMLPKSKYAVCPGIPHYVERYSALVRHTVKCLRKITLGDESLRCESVCCLLWHVPTDQRSIPGERLFNVCAHCKSVDRLLAKDAAAAAACTSDTRIARTLPTSNYPIEMLSPASQKAWMRRIIKNRKNFNAKLDKYSKLCVSLTDEQDNELSAVVSKINKNPPMRSELDEIFLEADKHKEGHGDILQDIWELDSTDKEFTMDQQKNSELFVRSRIWNVCSVYVHLKYPTHTHTHTHTHAHTHTHTHTHAHTYTHVHTHTHKCSLAEIGSCTNRWNVITYRLALAVYVRSPAAYEALKSLSTAVAM